MTNLDKAVELTNRSKDDLSENECPLHFGILPKRRCDDQCGECWEEELWALIPDCFKACECRVCKRHQETCCAKETEECTGHCPVLTRI